MSPILIIIVCLVLVLFVAIGIGVRMMFAPSTNSRLHALSARGIDRPMPGNSTRSQDDIRAKRESQRLEKEGEAAKPTTVNLKDKKILYFQAGIFSDEDRNELEKRTKIVYLIAIPLFGFAGFYFGGLMIAPIGGLIGLLAGRIYPDKVVNNRIKDRQEECSYYLPLVIEQLSIGVSSGLDIGPCISYVVEMANERGSNNVVTELFAHSFRLTKAGMSMEDSLLEIGTICGYSPAKNAFSFLAQCSRHGGEVSKQLMELSESVMMERQSIIEAKINALPNKATGTLGLIFGGFFIMIVSAIFIRIFLAL